MDLRILKSRSKGSKESLLYVGHKEVKIRFNRVCYFVCEVLIK